MDKILKPYTIIPPHLYVSRNADRQLRDIISDMGRPGYVLVSRQMGKTNLLLNAKRELGNEFDKFIYVDLSNTFEDEQSCFQNIIDLALETNENDYTEASKIINSNRKNQNNIPPHKQHTNELRVLLNHTKGKLIIILDEIDALTKTNYSDKIFAQIRSVYFSRVNFPELERLTYILSGVVEPSEIIKDPKISPFNIGEKIFLNDFSKEEFLVFLEKAKLDNLGNELIDRIYYWTNGNPRMTWDLCSEIENNLLETKLKEQIDEIVQKLYLTAFDKPPIDNIREIVISDKSIRDAIVEIDYNKGKEVADNIKSKLYLAGIINYEENDIKIKNKIIKNALNKNWLDSIKEQEQGLLSIALEYFEKENYVKAIEIYDKFILNNEFPDKETERLTYYHYGLGLYNISKFEKAIEILSKADFSIKVYPKLTCRIKKIIGICLIALKRPEESLEYFKFVIDQGIKDENYASALLNYGVSCSKLENNFNEAIEALERLSNENNFEDISDLEIDEFQSMANNNLGLLYKNDEAKARLFFDKALQTNNIELKPIFYFNIIKSSTNTNEKKSLLKLLVKSIIENNILPVDDDLERSLKITTKKLNEILISAFQLDVEEFEKIINYLFEKIYVKSSLIEILYELAFIELNSEIWDTGVEILKYSYNKYYSNIISNKNLFEYKTLKFLAYCIKVEENNVYASQYLASFKLHRHEAIDFYDFHIVTYVVVELMKNKQFTKAKEYLDLFYDLKNEVNENTLINYLLLNHLELQLYILSNNNIQGSIIANTILNDIEIKKYKNEQSNLLGDSGIENIKNAANNYLNPYSHVDNIQPKANTKGYMRNDKIRVKYNDGRLVEDKYKKLENDIMNQRCIIIDN